MEFSTETSVLLVRLSAELRNRIYEYAFTDLPQKHNHQIFTQVVELQDARPPAGALLFTCRQTYNGARGLYQTARIKYWSSTKFILLAAKHKGRSISQLVKLCNLELVKHMWITEDGSTKTEGDVSFDAGRIDGRCIDPSDFGLWRFHEISGKDLERLPLKDWSWPPPEGASSMDMGLESDVVAYSFSVNAFADRYGDGLVMSWMVADMSGLPLYPKIELCTAAANGPRYW